MANWITLKQLSEKRGIAESDLRTWANLGYIASSRIENVLMIDDESLAQYLDVHQTKDLGENYLEKIIKEKEGKQVPSMVDTGGTVVTKENVDTPDVKTLLYPEKL